MKGGDRDEETDTERQRSEIDRETEGVKDTYTNRDTGPPMKVILGTT